MMGFNKFNVLPVCSIINNNDLIHNENILCFVVGNCLLL